MQGSFRLLLFLGAVLLAACNLSCNRQRLVHVFLKGPDPDPVPIIFDSLPASGQFTFLFPGAAGNHYLDSLRQMHALHQVAGDEPGLPAILRLLNWTHHQWKHNGNNEPSGDDAITILREAGEGKNFRCVEYATVLSDALLSLGYTARVLALKSRDAETCKTAAGHVLVEFFLEDQDKWVLADAQFNTIPRSNGRLLNAVELQHAIVHQQPLELFDINGKLSNRRAKAYTAFIAPYLYYFETAFDHRRLSNQPAFSSAGKSHLMLVPTGAKNPTIFQRRFPIDYSFYTNNVQEFYQPPAIGTD